MVKLFSHRRRNTDVERGGATGSSPHPAIHSRTGSDGSVPACPSRLCPPHVPSLLIDPVLAEAMAGVIKGMQKPSKLSSDHFEAALGIAAIGADSFGQQAFLVCNSGTDHKFCASVISKWAERCRATGNKNKATPPLPSKVVADLLRKAAGPLSRRACPGRSDGIERQLELGLQRPVYRDVLDGAFSSEQEEEDTVSALGRQFHTVTAALLSALRGLGWEYGTGNLLDRNMNSDVNSSGRSSSGAGGSSGGGSSGNWATGVSEASATTSEESATRPAAEAPTDPNISFFSTARATSSPASFKIPTPPSSATSSPAHSPTTAPTPSTDDGSFPSLENCRCHHGPHGLPGQRPPPSPRLFTTNDSVSRLLTRAVKAEKESSMSRASAERLAGQLGDIKDQLQASESKSAAYASELERVSGRLVAAEKETAVCKENLEEACSYIRKLMAEKKSTDKLVAACHVRVKSLEDNVMAAVLQLEGAGVGAGAGGAAIPATLEGGDVFHDSIEAESGKKNARDENAGVRDVSLRIAVRSDVSSARNRAPRGNAASSCPGSDLINTSSPSSSSCASARSGVAGADRRSVAPERKAALDSAFSALAREAGAGASAVRAEVLSDIAAARRTKAPTQTFGPGRGSSSGGSDGDVVGGRGTGSRDGGDAETTTSATVAASKRDQFEEEEQTSDAPRLLQRCASQAGLFLSPPSLHNSPANSPGRSKGNAGVTNRKDGDGDDGDDDANRLLPSTETCGKRRPSIGERLRAAAAAPAAKLTAVTRRGFGASPLSPTKTVAEGARTSAETDQSVLLESPHRGGGGGGGGGGARGAADVATAAGAEAGNPTNAAAAAVATATDTMKKKPFRFHPFRHRLLHPGGAAVAAGGVNVGDASTGVTGEAGVCGGRPAGAEAWRTLEYNEGERARSLFLLRHELGFLKDVGAARAFRKAGTTERVGCGVFGEVFFLEFEEPAQKRAVCDFTKGAGLVAKRGYQNATEYGKASFAREIELVSSFLSPGCHENIVMYLSVSPEAIVMEAAAFDLQALLMDKRKLTAVPRTQRMGLVADAVRGLNYLHKHVNITHGDVKAANMVVDASCTVLKLCDFGLAGRSHKDKVMGCTPLYAAPEVVTGLMTADAAVMRPSMDTYAVGLVALQVLDLADEPRTARFADELDAQPAKMCDLRDTLLEPWLWDARGGLCFEEEVTKLMMAWLSRFPPHRPPLGTLEKALENGKLWSRASPEQMRRRLQQRRQDELEMW